MLADASCSREVGGGAALYFAPGDVTDLVAKLKEAISLNGRRDAAANGPTRGREFNWNSVASTTAELYRSLVS